MTSGGAFDRPVFHAEGGLGEVYRATQAELNREVALKFLKPKRADDPESVRRFLREAEVTGRLEHPGVVPVYGMGRDQDGHPCYAMRFVRGQTLQEGIDAFHAADAPGRDLSERSLALRGLLGRFVSVCNTIAYAHSRGILHRDIKPRNIMLGRFDETLVVDWGLAKSFDRDDDGRTDPSGQGSGSIAETPGTGDAVGTPAYMSPEQLSGEPQGPGSDVYGLGATLYALLVGRPPLPTRGENLREIAERIRGGDFPKPREVKPAVPPALEAICLKAMAPRSESRYRSALDLAADIDRWLADEPVSARRETFAERAVRWLRRHRPAVASAAAVLVLALVALAIANEQIRAQRGIAVAKGREAEEKAREAEANLATARSALDAILFEAARDEIAYIPRTEVLRRNQAARVVAFYESLLRERKDDPFVRSSTATACGLAARIDRLTGQFGRSIRLVGREIDLLDRLVEDYPFDVALRRRAASASQELGETYRLSGRPAEAEAAIRKALGLVATLRARDPGGCDPARLEATALLNLSGLQAETGDDAKSLESGRKAEDLLAKCPVNPSVDAKIRVLVLGSRGASLRGLKDMAGSEAAYREAIRVAEALADRERKDPDARCLVAESEKGLATLLAADPARRAVADRLLDQAIARSRRLSQQFPHIPFYRLQLASLLADRAESARAAGQIDAAEAGARESRAIGEALRKQTPDLSGVRTALGKALATLARIALARGDRETARGLFDSAISGHDAVLESNPRSRDDVEARKRCLAERGAIR